MPSSARPTHHSLSNPTREQPAGAARPRQLLHFYDGDGRLLAAELGSEIMFQRPMGELIGEMGHAFFVADDARRVEGAWLELIGSPGAVHHGRYQIEIPDGSTIWLQVTMTNLMHSHGYVRLELADVSGEMETLTTLRDQARLLERLTGSLPTGVVQLDGSHQVVFANDVFHEMVGAPPGTNPDDWLELFVDDDREMVRTTLEESFRDQSDLDIEVSVKPTGTHGLRRLHMIFRPLVAADQLEPGLLLCTDDITEAWELREKLARQALRDGLTGLPNRVAVLAALDAALDDARVHDTTTGLLFFDLDNFKEINDTYGHSAGDDVLIELGRLLQGRVRASDTVGRLGGDEFVAVCVDVGDAIEAVAARISNGLVATVEVDGESLACEASCGFAVDDGTMTAESLLEAADAQMYAAKRKRKTR